MAAILELHGAVPASCVYVACYLRKRWVGFALVFFHDKDGYCIDNLQWKIHGVLPLRRASVGHAQPLPGDDGFLCNPDRSHAVQAVVMLLCDTLTPHYPTSMSGGDSSTDCHVSRDC
mmetsp:Transcript_8374/g.12749  ORF Transcript_8374/g.12749 Transcript_8374/m.12749 type:complete len:117 (+) Transcript_8374:1182-1532(+)|eukprot:CAMPEP_0174310736 /NCGR_PEP_ID=MMETSP0810-20121108/3238_1 /TAXON_ID=73025 ORGANISM="Eutreptiella gymnastica-like, Strain CCMP1594" /NCGR_SAMPLE_ID=MMETSP0810 /ASSEMBLY_ACC=CAM_ASM_000659 /LENGTH=116 /DNA_ID=CAMNT_0015418727 /DNA_START=492 /DNA_END=842 /DNA_ORIENTATION=-